MFFSHKKTNRKLQASRKQPVKTRQFNLKPLLGFAAALLSVLAVLVLIAKSSDKIWFPITQVSVNGVLQHESKRAIQRLVLKDLQAGFFDVDLDNISKKIKTRSWVAESTVRRVWPNSIDVLVREHQAIAVWNKRSLMSTQGDIFQVNNIQEFKKYPHLTGKNERAKQILLAFSQLEYELNDAGLSVVNLDNKKMDEIAVQFNTGLHALLSFSDKDRQIQRLKSLLAKGFINQQHIASIDLRYNNGFSVVFNEAKQTSVINAHQFQHLTKSEHYV